MNEIVVLSGKGGTGKTSISAAFATIAKDMVAADCDVDAANLRLILNPENYREEPFISGHKAMIDKAICTNCAVCVDYCRFDAMHVIADEVVISDVSCDGCQLCMRVCPEDAITMVPEDKSRWFEGVYRNGTLIHARLAPGEENSGKLVDKVREQARKTAKDRGVDTVVIDGPPGIGCPAISALTGAKVAVLVTEPTVTGLHDLKRVVELARGFKVKVFVIINKWDINPEMTKVIADWLDSEDVEMVGRLPFSEQFVASMIQSKSIIEYAPYSEISRTLQEIWKTVLEAMR